MNTVELKDAHSGVFEFAHKKNDIESMHQVTTS